MTDMEYIDDLKAQIERQRAGSRVIEDLMQDRDKRIEELEKKIKILEGGLAMCGPAALWPNA